MIPYFAYQRYKQKQAERLKAAKAEEVLTQQDEKYLEHLVDDDQPRQIPLSAIDGSGAGSSSSHKHVDHYGAKLGPEEPHKFPQTVRSSSRSPTRSRPSSANSNTSATADKHDWKTDIMDRAKNVKMPSMPSMSNMPSLPSVPVPGFLQSKKDGKKKADGAKTPESDAEDIAELTAEERELHEALDKLNLAAQDGIAFSLSAETKVLLNRFTQVLKDIVNGVPTAYQDLITLFESSSTQIEKLFENTPGFLKKLVKQIPLGASSKEGSNAEGLDVAAKTAMLSLPTLSEIVKKPGATVATLKTVMNALKFRFPALAVGSNVLYSMGLFVLLFVFWYCYKRGKETRLEKEQAEYDASAAALADAPDAPTADPSSNPTSTTRTVANEPMAVEQSTEGSKPKDLTEETVPVKLSEG